MIGAGFAVLATNSLLPVIILREHKFRHRDSQYVLEKLSVLKVDSTDNKNS
ncbi:MAG: hypothetical protein ACJ73C_14580 [Nitrososphaeraceae archaeon]